MKVLILNGSYRQNGNTARVLSLFECSLHSLARAQGIGIEVEDVSLGKLNLNYCRGCRLCYDMGFEKCPNQDGMPSLFEKMKTADGLVLASPVYVDDMSGIVKNFIDRLCHQCHRPGFAGKTAFVIATTGSSSPSKTLNNLKLSLQLWGYRVSGKAGFVTGALMKKEEIGAKYGREIQKNAEKYILDVSRQTVRPPDFLALLIFIVQQIAWMKKTQAGSVDHNYWENNGWLKKETTYYYPHHASAAKVWLARMAGLLISKFVM